MEDRMIKLIGGMMWLGQLKLQETQKAKTMPSGFLDKWKPLYMLDSSKLFYD